MGKKDSALSTGLLAAEVTTPQAAAPAALEEVVGGDRPKLELAAEEEEGLPPRTDSPGSPDAESPRFDAFRPAATVVIQSERGERVMARTLFDEASAEALRAEEKAKSSQRWMFAAFCLLEVVANFDAGVLPAVQMHMSREYQLGHTEAGLLGSLVYYGMVIGTPIAGYCLTNTANQNVVVILGALLNTVSIMMFALAPTEHFLYLGRFLMGASQGGIFVYAPVWVDEFSPESRQALWMATLQGSVVLGIVLGYMVGGAFVGYWQPWTCTTKNALGAEFGRPEEYESFDTEYEQAHLEECYNEHWKNSLYLQALCMGTFVLFYLGSDATLVNSKGGERERIRWRTHALYREAIVKLKPINVDESVRQALGDGAHISAATASSGAWSSNHIQKNIATVVASLVSTSSDTKSSSNSARARKSKNGSVPDTAKRRSSVPDLLDIAASMISHPQDGIGALVDVGEDMTRALGAGSMSGGGNVQSVQGIMDLFGEDASSSGASSVGQLSLIEQLTMLRQSSLYIWLTLALCSLYYVVTGTQFWITEYANAPPPEGLGVDPTTVLWSFAFTSVTAPVIGVFLGGWVIDRQGGYDEVYPTLRTCLYFGIGAAVSAVPAAHSTDFTVVMVALWLILFFGGCIISPATGVCINAVHADLRSFSSAMSMFAYNLLGYGAAPLIGGKVADMYDIGAGYRSIVYGVFVAGGIFAVACQIAKQAAADPPLADAAVIELLRRATVDSTDHISQEDLATLRQAAGRATPEQADVMAKWLSERLQHAMGKTQAVPASPRLNSGFNAECPPSTAVTLKSLTTIKQCLDATGSLSNFRRAVSNACSKQVHAATSYNVIDPEFGEKPAAVVRRQAGEVSLLLK